MENSHDTQKMIEILEVIRKDFKEFQEKQNNNYKEQMELIKEQQSFFKEQFKDFKKMYLQVQTHKINDGVHGDIRNHRWISSIGLVTIVGAVIGTLAFIFSTPNTVFFVILKTKIVFIFTIVIAWFLVRNKRDTDKRLEESLKENADKIADIQEEYIDIN